MKKASETIARGVRLDRQVWAALRKLKATHGSYNKGLRVVLLDSAPVERKEKR